MTELFCITLFRPKGEGKFYRFDIGSDSDELCFWRASKIIEANDNWGIETYGWQEREVCQCGVLATQGRYCKRCLDLELSDQSSEDIEAAASAFDFVVGTQYYDPRAGNYAALNKPEHGRSLLRLFCSRDDCISDADFVCLCFGPHIEDRPTTKDAKPTHFQYLCARCERVRGDKTKDYLA